MYQPAEVLVFCFQKIFQDQTMVCWVPGFEVAFAAGPGAGALLGTFEV